MINNRLLSRTAATSPRGGFTLVELLVVISIIAILASVALGPIMSGVKQAKHSSAMQGARSIGLVEFQYGNDNQQVYPDATTSEGIAQLLVDGKYASDPKLFCIPFGTYKAAVGAAGIITMTKDNITFDFMGINTTVNSGASGLTSNSADGTPAVWTTGGAVTPANVGPWDITLTASDAPFSQDGVAVCYKSNSAQWLQSGNKKADGSTAGKGVVGDFVDGSYNDPLATGGTSSYQVKKP